MSLESDGGMTGENRRTRIKTCPSATLSTTNPTCIEPGANTGLCGERPATNDLSHGTALLLALINYSRIILRVNSSKTTNAPIIRAIIALMMETEMVCETLVAEKVVVSNPIIKYSRFTSRVSWLRGEKKQRFKDDASSSSGY
jgi:hypothetical protein